MIILTFKISGPLRFDASQLFSEIGVSELWSSSLSASAENRDGREHKSDTRLHYNESNGPPNEFVTVVSGPWHNSATAVTVIQEKNNRTSTRQKIAHHLSRRFSPDHSLSYKRRVRSKKQQ